MPQKNVPETQETDELEMCYLLITSRHIEHQGGFFVYLFLLGAFLAVAGALTLALDFAGVL